LTGRRVRLLLVGGTLAAILIFPFSDYFRYEDTGRRTIASSSIVETLSLKDYDQISMIANGIWWIDARGGHTMGRQVLGDVMFWYPRSSWPEKPVDTGVAIGRAMQLSQTNLSSPLWIESWVDFGVVGTAFALSAWGYFARRVDRAFIQWLRFAPKGAIGAASIGAPVVAGYEFILLRGPLLQSMGRIAVFVVVVLTLTRKPPRRTHKGKAANDAHRVLPTSTA